MRRPAIDAHHGVSLRAQSQRFGVAQLVGRIHFGVAHGDQRAAGALAHQRQHRRVDGDGVSRGEQADVVEQRWLVDAQAIAVLGDRHGRGQVGDASRLAAHHGGGTLDTALL